MSRATTFLIVFVLAGGSTVSVMCDRWCPRASAEHRSGACHDASPAPAAGELVTGTSAACDDGVAAVPFLTGSRTELTNPLAAPATLPPDAAPMAFAADKLSSARDMNGPVLPGKHQVLRI